MLTPSVTIKENQAIRDAQSFIEIFCEREKLHPNDIYLRQAANGIWTEYSWTDVGDMARKLLAALRSKGLKKGDHIGLLSKNCYQWIVADLAILMGGFVSVPFYPTLPKSDLSEVIQLSEIKALFVGKLESWEEQKQAVPAALLCIDFGHYPGNSIVENDCQLHWSNIMRDFEPDKDVYVPTPDDLFTLIYTSGTTGTPKGVMVDYNCANEVMNFERNTPVYGIYQGVGERVLSYLPLNHIAERVVSEVGPIVAGSVVSFSESLDEFANNLQSVQPTQFFAVPRIWTKIQQGILGKLSDKKLNTLLKLPLINNLLKKKLKTAIGLNEVKSAISGAAPLSASLLEWYAKLDINIQEVYGATELCGGVTFNALDDITPGTVGRALPGVEIKIDSTSDEVMIKAPWVMKGYYNDPEKTAEVLTDDGWYRTGDRGRIDNSGHLIITGRLKDTFKTAKGKFIVPVPIEQQLGGNFLIEQVMVTGFGMVQPFALVCLSENTADMSDEELTASLHETLDATNSQLEAYTKLSHFVVFRKPWAEDSGYFTPTLKIKRHVVNDAFKENYELWTSKKGKIVWV
jgi:long-subunit acyl-CoA synthetase (AMP-forming)